MNLKKIIILGLAILILVASILFVCHRKNSSLERTLDNSVELVNGGDLDGRDRFFPSSKLCSNCGTKNDDLELAVREWICTSCGSHHDRDVNAAINLRNNAVSYMVSACGELVGSRLCEVGTQHHN